MNSTRKTVADLERAFLLDGDDDDARDRFAREEFDRIEEEQRVADIRSALQNPATARMLWRFFERSGILQTSFDNSGWTSFFEGRREQSLWMLKQIAEAKGETGQMTAAKMMSEIESLRATRLEPSKQ
jgi:hypothetical protein